MTMAGDGTLIVPEIETRNRGKEKIYSMDK
jgi:hypothetical protein